MKILADTNIILDVLCKRPGLYEDSAKLFKLCENGRISGVVSALSIPNIVYIMRKELDAEKIKEVLGYLSLIFSISDLKSSDLIKAASMNFKDYEDAIQSACALRIKADYIVTRNLKDFTKSKVMAVNPSGLFKELGLYY